MGAMIPLFGSYNYKLPTEILDVLLQKEYYQKYKQNNNDQPTYGSFLNLNGSDEERIFFDKLNTFYSPIIDFFMKDIGQYKNAKYRWEIWWQLYEPNSPGFKIHKHCGRQGDPQVISFNHFVKIANGKSFFSWVFGNKKEILHEEKEGEIIFFPGIAFHKVSPNNTDEYRLTISGNIYIIDSLGYYEDGEYPE